MNVEIYRDNPTECKFNQDSFFHDIEEMCHKALLQSRITSAEPDPLQRLAQAVSSRVVPTNCNFPHSHLVSIDTTPFLSLPNY